MNLPLNTLATDTGDVAQARYNLIEQQIRPWDVLDPEILALLARMKREHFVPAQHRAHAFADLQVPLLPDAEAARATGRCMLEPKVEARMLQDLQVKPTDKVLEIGTGSGYMAALLSYRAQRVITLETDAALAGSARRNLQAAGIHNVDVREADGSVEQPIEGPFDVIVLSGSVAAVPDALLRQLKAGGRLGAIVGDEPMMRARFVVRTASGFDVDEPWDTVAPRLSGFAETPRFVF